MNHGQSFRPPEIAGMISLMNASPIGDSRKRVEKRSWSVTLVPISKLSGSFADLSDVEIEMNLVGQPVR